MLTPSEQDLETWINARKQTPPARLTKAVMEAIQDDTQPLKQSAFTPKPPSWLVAFVCLLAGVGKLSLVFHLAF